MPVLFFFVRPRSRAFCIGGNMMTTEQFNCERDYRVSMAIIKSLLEKELITPKEYAKIDTIMTKKYCPIIGSL